MRLGVWNAVWRCASKILQYTPGAFPVALTGVMRVAIKPSGDLYGVGACAVGRKA